MDILFHSITTHYPIALFFLEALLIILWVRKNDTRYKEFAWLTYRLGFVFLVFVMLSGIFETHDWGGLFGIVRSHTLSAFVVFFIYVFRGYWWLYQDNGTKTYQQVHLWSAVLGNCFMILSGHIGGKLLHG